MRNQIEQETLSSGARYLMTTPVEPNNLSVIWDQAIKYMMNGNFDPLMEKLVLTIYNNKFMVSPSCSFFF